MGEGATLGDGRYVSSEGEDHLQDVAGFGDVLAAGDDTQDVAVAARVAATDRPWRVVTDETRQMLSSTVSDW